MTAVLLTGNGGFDKLSVRTDVEVPRPGLREVLIRVGAAGVNNTDINTRTAWYSKSVVEGTQGDGHGAARPDDSGWTGAAPAFPRIQGADAAGRIVAVGEGVAPARVGERVLVEPVFRVPGEASAYRVRYFGSECDGAFADYAVAPAAHAHRIACALSDAELATFPCSYSAAENMLTKAGVAAGETVLVTGASGGVGSAAVQLARRRGARVIALAGSAKAGSAKAADVMALGAERVLPREADLLAELGVDAVDVAIDVVGGAAFPRLLDVLRRGGRYAVAGAIAGPVVQLDLRTLYLKDLRLLGCTILEPGVFARLIGYIERREIVPVLAATFALRDIVAAQQAFLTKRHTGKIVLLPPG
jgi:NADPH:quinone reductase-like Zn-dependent oxidoreductase